MARKQGRVLFSEWVAEVGGTAPAAALLNRRAASGIDHLCSGRRGIRKDVAQAVEKVSKGKYTAIELMFGEQAKVA